MKPLAIVINDWCSLSSIKFSTVIGHNHKYLLRCIIPNGFVIDLQLLIMAVVLPLLEYIFGESIHSLKFIKNLNCRFDIYIQNLVPSI